MNILALDTTMNACSAAILKSSGGQKEIFRYFENRSRGHAEVIIPIIDDLMKQAKLRYHDLSRIAVTTGPGTFTGVRVGVAAARAIALAADIPVVCCSSLQLIAGAELYRSSGECPIPSIAVISDARRGQVYFAFFDHEGEEIVAPCLVPIGCVSEILKDKRRTSSREIQAVGSAVPEFLKLNPDEPVLPSESESNPDAAFLVEMAAHLPVSNVAVQPLYLRQADAKPQGSRAIPRQ